MATLAQLIAEGCRLRLMRGLEDLLASCGYALVAGVDEVGRGCLAGPVVAAAVIPDLATTVPGVDDSKCLAPPDRERVAAGILASCRAVAVAAIDAAGIDSLNILEASREAMARALAALAPQPDCVVVDAVFVRGLRCPCLPLVRGDRISYAVAAASIVAKVARDRMMADLDHLYPQYGFAEHKGYAAPEHLRALAEYGPSPIHRLTFHAVVPRREAAV
jgi:ribonuclease HII